MLCGLDPSFDSAGELLCRIALRVRGSGEEHDARPDEDERAAGEATSFLAALGEGDGWPLWVEVPASLTEGHRVFCTSVMIVRRHVPLRHLRSPWLLLLVDPPTCPFAIVLPMGYWDAATRRRWKMGPMDDPKSS